MNQYLQRSLNEMHIFSGFFFLVLCSSGSAGAALASDEFIRGYATAILQRDFQITAETLSVQSGVIYIRGLEASDVVRDRMKSSLSSIDGVSQVVVAEDGEFAPTGGISDITTEVNVFLPRDLLSNRFLRIRAGRISLSLISNTCKTVSWRGWARRPSAKPSASIALQARGTVK